jgi:hypothetical protein
MGSRAPGALREMANPLLSLAGKAIREARPKQVALSGPAGRAGWHSTPGGCQLGYMERAHSNTTEGPARTTLADIN